MADHHATDFCPTLSFPLILKKSASAGVMLYSGVSNRSRGWKSRKQVDLWPMDSIRLVRQPSLKKFDGAARSCIAWDFQRKDPELWLRNGNCFVHLYEKGQSQRGPAFKILFASLLSDKCQPLIERFVDRAVSEEEAHQNGKVDLYIPTPAGASRTQSAQYHLAIRNFLAWVSRRSLVGQHLGMALIGLANAMNEFRESDADNTKDLYAYMEEEGYLDMRNQPNHALAILHVSEAFQMREMYIDAFTHCVGMSEHLYKHQEYARISVASRKLIRRARVDMDFRLSRAGAMLGDFLQEELSEAHLGLSTGARAHLDRFRAYIHGFYTTKFGSFPPPAVEQKYSTILPPDVYRCMRADFEALYQYLVDETFTTTDNAPAMAQGGLCALQSVHEFDLRHKFSPLSHPLPLLPEPVQNKDYRRRRSMPWFMGSVRSRHGKLRPDQRLVVHAALMRATNHVNVDLLDNELVLAYREFEQDSITIYHKGERSEKLGVTPGDARKVRWLLIYAVYQTLLSCTEIPVEVRDTSKVMYNLGVSTKSLPPWPAPACEYQDSSTLQPRGPERRQSIGAVPLLSPIVSPLAEGAGGIEIKPDIDYFALTHQEATTQSPRGRGASNSSNNNNNSQINNGSTTPRSRSQSLTRTMSLRRSLSIFRSPTQRRASISMGSPGRSGRKGMYHEIIVQGYGNGTNSVTEEGLPPPPQLTVVTTASRSASTSSTNSCGSAISSSPSTAAQSMASTTPTTVVDPQTPTSSRQTSESWMSTYTLVHKPSYDDLTFPIRRQTSARKCIKDMYSNDDMLAAAARSEPPPLPRRSSKRFRQSAAGAASVVVVPSKRWSLVNVSAELRQEDASGSENDEEVMQPSPLRIRKISPRVEDDVFRDDDDDDDDDDAWEELALTSNKADISTPCVWEQFEDLGGLQPIHLLG